MKPDLILASAFKFVTFVLFAFMVLVYLGVLIVLPLDILFQLIRLFSGIGLPIVLAMALGIAALGYLGHRIYRTPALYKLVIDIGVQLISFGYGQIKRFDPLIEAAREADQKNTGTA